MGPDVLPCDQNDLYEQGTEVEIHGLSPAHDDLNGSLAKVLGKDAAEPTRYKVENLRPHRIKWKIVSLKMENLRPTPKLSLGAVVTPMFYLKLPDVLNRIILEYAWWVCRNPNGRICEPDGPEYRDLRDDPDLKAYINRIKPNFEEEPLPEKVKATAESHYSQSTDGMTLDEWGCCH